MSATETARKISFAGLTLEVSDAPERVSVRRSNNPMVALVKESWDARKKGNDLGKEMRIIAPTPEIAATLVKLIRSAASAVGEEVGTTVYPVENLPGNQRAIFFAAKVKNRRKNGDVALSAVEIIK